MNSIMRDYYPVLEMYQSLRSQLMESLSDADLRFSPGGENVTLGALCREIGETEQVYIDSFRTFKCDFTYRHPESAIEQSVNRLKEWYARLDGELKQVVSSLSDETIQCEMVERGGKMSVDVNLHVYQEALLLFYGKVDIYLKSMGKPRSEQWSEWIA